MGCHVPVGNNKSSGDRRSQQAVQDSEPFRVGSHFGAAQSDRPLHRPMGAEPERNPEKSYWAQEGRCSRQHSHLETRECDQGDQDQGRSGRHTGRRARSA